MEQTTVAAWYEDPQWWAIAASFVASIGSVIWSRVEKRVDAARDIASEEWLITYRSRLTNALDGLNALLRDVDTARAMGKKSARHAELKRIYKSVPVKFNLLGEVLIEIDLRYGSQGEWGELYVDPQDYVSKAMDTLCNTEAAEDRCESAVSELAHAVRGLKTEVDKKAANMRVRLKRGKVT